MTASSPCSTSTPICKKGSGATVALDIWPCSMNLENVRITRMQNFLDPAEALEAAGLREEPRLLPFAQSRSGPGGRLFEPSGKCDSTSAWTRGVTPGPHHELLGERGSPFDDAGARVEARLDMGLAALGEHVASRDAVPPVGDGIPESDLGFGWRADWDGAVLGSPRQRVPDRRAPRPGCLRGAGRQRARRGRGRRDPPANCQPHDRLLLEGMRSPPPTPTCGGRRHGD